MGQGQNGRIDSTPRLERQTNKQTDSQTQRETHRRWMGSQTAAKGEREKQRVKIVTLGDKIVM